MEEYLASERLSWPVRLFDCVPMVNGGLAYIVTRADDARAITPKPAYLRGFAEGIRRGTRVRIEQTIGYVGSTGLSTAPHLHFEILVGGQFRDPRRALAMVESGPPLSGTELARFEQARDAVLFALEQPAGPLRALGN